MRRAGFAAGAVARALLVGAAVTAFVLSAETALGQALPDLQQARTAVEQRQYVAALEQYERLLQQRPDDADLLIEVARVHGYADRNAEAARLYRRVLQVAPQRRADVLASLAWQTLWAGQGADAVPLFTEWLARPDADRVEALDGLGQARQAAGDFSGALQAYRQAHAQAPDNLRLHRRLAMALLWTGDEDGAVRELQALSARAPADRDLAWALANARNFAGQHRLALQGFVRWPAPTHPGEKADVARAWRWAGYEERALPLLQGQTDEQAVWLRDWRVRRELAPYGYASVERAEDRDGLVARAQVLGAGWHPAPGATAEFNLRRLQLDDGFGQPEGTQLQGLLRWRVGEPDSRWGTVWPTLALRVNRLPGWQTLSPTARLRWLPQDRLRVDAEATRELVEAPRAVANRVTVDVASLGVDARVDARWGWAGSAALLRFDDGTTRVRVLGRLDRLLQARPRLTAGLEFNAFDRVSGSQGLDRGYWNPRRYTEGRAFVAMSADWRPLDLDARLGLGLSREVDDSGRASSGRPHQWELGLGADLAPALRVRLAMGGAGQGLGLQGGGAGYWRRYVNLSASGWF